MSSTWISSRRTRPPTSHRHPALVAAAKEQLERLTLTSRAFHHDQLAPFAEGLAALIGKDMVLPMNAGAEAVESAIKVARKWGYEVKGVPDGRAVIIVASGNFHGRTTTIISFPTILALMIISDRTRFHLRAVR